MKVPFVDFSLDYEKRKEMLEGRVIQAMALGAYINGPEVAEFSQKLGEHLQVDFVLPCANGTDALFLALKSLGLRPGSKVLVPAFGFVSAAEACINAGLQPIFYPLEEETYGFNPDLVPSEKEKYHDISAIILVHLFGLHSNVTLVVEWARERDMRVIEDHSQSLGNIVKAPNTMLLGDIGTTSFFPTKNLGCFGDGGAAYTFNKAFYDRMNTLSKHGASKKYFYESVGVNSRLDTLQAAILLEKLRFLDADLEKRKANAAMYHKGFMDLDVKIPPLKDQFTYNSYTIQVKNEVRDSLRQYLLEHGIQTMVYYPHLLCDTPAYKNFNLMENIESNRELCRKVLSLSVHPSLSKEKVDYVVRKIKEFL